MIMNTSKRTLWIFQNVQWIVKIEGVGNITITRSNTSMMGIFWDGIVTTTMTWWRRWRLIRTLCEAWEDTGVGTRVKWDWGFQGLVQLRSLIEEDNDEEDDGDGGGGDEGGDGDGHLEDPEYAHHPYKTKHFPSSADHQGVLHRHDHHDHHDHRHDHDHNDQWSLNIITIINRVIITLIYSILSRMSRKTTYVCTHFGDKI